MVVLFPTNRWRLDGAILGQKIFGKPICVFACISTLLFPPLKDLDFHIFLPKGNGLRDTFL